MTHRYVRDLEQVMILTAAAFGITATRFRADRRLGRLARSQRSVSGSRALVTSHGFALNVAPDLAHFDLIVPWRIADRG